MIKHYFHEVARAERYFTATLLPHLLMVDNFKGTKLLFKQIFKYFNFIDKDDFEIISELDPIRDGSVYNSEIKKIYKNSGRIAVPDLFIRWGEKILAIEAKFFTQPSSDELQDQLKLQKDAFDKIIDKTKYEICNIQQCLLIINKPDYNLGGHIHILTWDNVVDILVKWGIPDYSKDCEYSIGILKQSIVRAKKELTKTAKHPSKKINSIEELIKKLPQLIESKEIWVGFSEGIDLVDLDLKYLIERNHYKVSKERYSQNWIRIDELISRYIDLKFINKDKTTI